MEEMLASNPSRNKPQKRDDPTLEPVEEQSCCLATMANHIQSEHGIVGALPLQ